MKDTFDKWVNFWLHLKQINDYLLYRNNLKKRLKF